MPPILTSSSGKKASSYKALHIVANDLAPRVRSLVGSYSLDELIYSLLNAQWRLLAGCLLSLGRHRGARAIGSQCHEVRAVRSTKLGRFEEPLAFYSST